MASREVELASALYQAMLDKKELAEEAETLSKKIKDTEQKIIELLIEEGKSSTGHITGVGELTLKPRTYLSVNKSDMASCVEALKRTGNGGMVKETVEANTLTTFLTDYHEKLCMEMEADDNKRGVLARTMGFDDPYAVTIQEIAAKSLEKTFCAKSFTETKLSFTKKGK